jgi:hypothetical protein
MIGVKSFAIIASQLVLFSKKDYSYLDVAKTIEHKIEVEKDTAKKSAYIAKLDTFKRASVGFGGYMTIRQNLLGELSRPSVKEAMVTDLFSQINAQIIKMEGILAQLPAIDVKPII